jgi:ribose transport system substrate-binding protein
MRKTEILLIGLLVIALLCAETVFAKGGKESPKQGVRIGMVLKTLSSQYWQTIAMGARDAAQEHNADLFILGPPREDAVEEQLALVRDLMDQGIQVLVFSPSEPDRSVAVLSEAKRRGIPVILVDTAMPEGFHDYAVFIGTDNVEAGRQGARELRARLKPGAQVALLEGDPVNTTTRERINAAEAELRDAGFGVIREAAYSDHERAYRITLGLLDRVNVDGVFAANDEMALGALQALQQKGRYDVTVIGVDGTTDALHSILRGSLYGSLAQKSYDMGRLSVERALDLAAGKTVDRRSLNGTELITLANAPAYLYFLSTILRTD